MRQLVLVDDTVELEDGVLLGRLLAARLPQTPVLAFDPVGAGDGAGPTDLATSRPWSVEVDYREFAAEDGRRLLVTRHPDGTFPKAIDGRTRAMFTACDTVLVRCPARQFLEAVRFYERSLFALNGAMTQANVLAASNFLTGMTDRLRADAARRRHLGHFGAAEDAPPEADLREPVRRANFDLEAAAFAEEIPVLETRPEAFSQDATRLGFEFIERKIRRAGPSINVLEGPPGIAVFGPYTRLDAGAYRLTLDLDAGGEPGLAFTLEAVWGAGANTLAGYDFRFEAPTDRAEAILAFEVEAAAVQQPLEFRLWNAEGSPPFRLTSLQLTRVLS